MKMKVIRSLVLSALAGALALSAGCEDASADNKKAAYPYMDFQLAPKPVVGRKKNSKKKKQEGATPQTLRQTASSELAVTQKEKSSEILATPATVRLSVEQVKSPIVYSAFQMGLSVQSYQPVGQGRVEGLDSYDYSNLGSRPMAAVDFRWLPFEFESVPNTNFGGYVSVGYSQHPVNLRSPTGSELKNTKLQTTKAQLGLAVSKHLPSRPRWSGTLLMGAGRLESVQSSDSAFVNNSSSLVYGSAALLAEYRWFDRWSVTVGYENRLRLTRTSDNLDVQNHNLMLGFLGSFR